MPAAANAQRLATDPHQPICSSLLPQQPTWNPVPGTYIVRFTHYAPHARHEASLASALDGRVSRRDWAWRPRVNPGASLPTDFGVVVLTAAAKVSGKRGVGRF